MYTSVKNEGAAGVLARIRPRLWRIVRRLRAGGQETHWGFDGSDEPAAPACGLRVRRRAGRGRLDVLDADHDGDALDRADAIGLQEFVVMLDRDAAVGVAVRSQHVAVHEQADTPERIAAI